MSVVHARRYQSANGAESRSDVGRIADHDDIEPVEPQQPIGHAGDVGGAHAIDQLRPSLQVIGAQIAPLQGNQQLGERAAADQLQGE
jgi:hypothetical protein